MKRNQFPEKRIFLIFFTCFISMSIVAQNIKPDSLNFKELNQYIVKANKMKNAGMILTISGIATVTAGYIASSFWSGSTSLEGWEVFKTLIPFYIGSLVGIPASIVGIPLWVIGGSRCAKAEIALRKFNFKPNDPMAVGIGITIRF